MKKQQQFTVEQYAAAKEKAKEFGINFVGKSKQTLVDLVNAELAKQAPAAKAEKQPKWYENGYGFNPGDVVEIIVKNVVKGGVAKEILKGRKASIVKPAATEGTVKALLIDEKTGELQNCEILLEIKNIFLVTPAKQEQVA